MSPSDNLPFGQTVREAREARKITLRKFAEQLEISPTYLSQMERGEIINIGEETIKRLAQALDLDEDELLAKAGKIASDLKEIIREQPTVFADFLRTANGRSNEEIQRITNKLKKDR